MMTVHEVSRLSGVSVRTLRYYDEIGLLPPSGVSPAGYRLYDGAALERLQSILLLRELQFPLREIRDILDRPGFDRRQALEDQIQMLKMREEHLRGLIRLAEKLKTNGGEPMSFEAFDTGKMEEYAREAKKKWGATQEYREYAGRAAGRTEKDTAAAADGLMRIFEEFGRVRHLPNDGPEAAALVKKLQAYITDHFYTCSGAVLRGLADLYAAGGEMTENIDRAGGEGTAVFAAEAIRARGEDL